MKIKNQSWIIMNADTLVPYKNIEMPHGPPRKGHGKSGSHAAFLLAVPCMG
jgi:hypothetical protein